MLDLFGNLEIDVGVLTACRCVLRCSRINQSRRRNEAEWEAEAVGGDGRREDLELVFLTFFSAVNLFVFWMNRLQGSPVFNGFWQRFASSCWLVRNLIWWRNDSEGYRSRKRDGGECRERRVWWRTAWVSSLSWMMLISHLDVCAHLWVSEHHRPPPPPAPLRTSGPPSGPRLRPYESSLTLSRLRAAAALINSSGWSWLTELNQTEGELWRCGAAL